MNLSMADRLHGAIEAYEHQRLDDPEHDAWVELDIPHARAILSLLEYAVEMRDLLDEFENENRNAGTYPDQCDRARTVLSNWNKLIAKDLSNS